MLDVLHYSMSVGTYICIQEWSWKRSATCFNLTAARRRFLKRFWGIQEFQIPIYILEDMTHERHSLWSKTVFSHLRRDEVHLRGVNMWRPVAGATGRLTPRRHVACHVAEAFFCALRRLNAFLPPSSPRSLHSVLTRLERGQLFLCEYPTILFDLCGDETFYYICTSVWVLIVR